MLSDRKPTDALNLALEAIAARFGAGTADVVAMQLEYRRETGPRFALCCQALCS